MLPAPRQRWVNDLAKFEDRLGEIDTRCLLIHGREDQVIPLDASLRLLRLFGDAQLHVFGRCGHWTQIEHARTFNRLVRDFLTEEA